MQTLLYNPAKSGTVGASMILGLDEENKSILLNDEQVRVRVNMHVMSVVSALCS